MNFLARLKRVAETIGLVCFVLLALYGVMSLVRGDLLRSVHAQDTPPQFEQVAPASYDQVEASALPAVIHYQGDLRSAAGQLLEGTYDLTFRIYDVAIGGTALYSEVHPKVPVRTGHFSVLLGDITAFPAGLFSGPDRFIGLTVGSDTEMMPRQRFGTAPYAFWADGTAKAALADRATDADKAADSDKLDGHHWSEIPKPPAPVPSGTIVAFMGATLPSGWLWCNGAAYAAADYPELAAALGEVYAASGDGTFAVPDLRGRVPLGAGQGGGLSNRPLGSTGGEENHVLAWGEMPAHTHSLTTVPWYDAPGGYSGGGWWGDPMTFDTNSAGGNQPHNNMQPYLAVNFIIKQ